MKLTHWIGMAAVAALGFTALQAQEAQTTKGKRLDVALTASDHPSAVRTSGGNWACPHCKTAMAQVCVPLDSKQRAFGTRYVSEFRCSGCKFRVRRDASGPKQTRNVIECTARCGR